MLVKGINSWKSYTTDGTTGIVKNLSKHIEFMRAHGLSVNEICNILESTPDELKMVISNNSTLGK